MTIEYKDSKRIVGLSTDKLPSSTYETDFSSTTGWSVESGGITYVDSIHFNHPSGVAMNTGVLYDLTTSNVSETSWTLDYDLNITTSTGGSGSSCQLFIGLSNNSTVSSSAINTAQDYLGHFMIEAAGTHAIRKGNGSDSPEDPVGTVFSRPLEADVLYCRLQRISEIKGTLSLYSDQGRTSLIESKDITITTSLEGLRYLKVILACKTTSGTHVMVGDITNMKFWNTITSGIESKPTDAQDNSIMVEKDTARRYWFSKPTTFEQNFDSNTGHTANQTTVNGWYAEDYTKIAYDGTNHYLKYASMGSTNWGASFDLQQSGNNGVGSAINSSKWTLRFKWHILTNSGSTSNGSQGAFGISSVPATTLNNQDFMGFSMRQHASGGEVGLFNATLDNNNPMNQGASDKKFVTGNLSAGTTYYAEIIRDGDKCTTTLRTGSHTGTQVGSMERTVTGISGLRYLYYKAQQDSASATHTSYIDDIDFINGTDTWTMQPTWRDDFSSVKGWVSANSTYSSVNTSTEKIDFDFDAGDGNADKQIYYDLTSVDTNWVLRFKLNWSALTSANNAYMYVGLTDNVGGTGTTQNGFELRFINAPAAGSQYVDFGVNQINNTLPYNLGTSSSTSNMVYTTSKDYYVEMKKDGTSLTATVFENSDFTGMWQTATETITTTITPSLRYLHFWNSMSANTGAWTGTIDDVEFYNGVTSIN